MEVGNPDEEREMGPEEKEESSSTTQSSTFLLC
jgi:hypothetical protein